MYVDFEGSVNGTKKESININGLFAGAITENDMDIITDGNDNKISINTIINAIDNGNETALNEFAAQKGLGAVNKENAVNITINKHYPGQSSEESVTETNFPFCSRTRTPPPASGFIGQNCPERPINT